MHGVVVLLILLILSLFTFPGFGAEGDTGLVTSRPCGKSQPERRGAGLLVRDGDRLFVVTSSEAMFHGASACTDWESTAGKAALQFIGASTLHGLALAEVPKAAASYETLRSDAVAVDRLSADLPTNRVKVELDGFSKSGARESRVGLLVSGDNARTTLPMAGVATLQAQIHQGFVGAPVRAEGEGVLGIVSQQYLSIGPGRPSRLESHGNGAAPFGVMLPIIVRRGAVLSWVKDVTEGKPGVRFEEPIDAQTRAVHVLDFSALRFEELNCTSTSRVESAREGAPIGGGQGAGIGGGQGAGIGGGQGAGIGGLHWETTTHLAAGECRIRVTRLAVQSLAPWPLPASDAYDSLLGSVPAAGASVTITTLANADRSVIDYPENILQILVAFHRGLIPGTVAVENPRFLGVLTFADPKPVEMRLELRKPRFVRTLTVRMSNGCFPRGEYDTLALLGVRDGLHQLIKVPASDERVLADGGYGAFTLDMSSGLRLESLTLRAKAAPGRLCVGTFYADYAE